jgi:diguanylate cyclase (GGDEF)-like protein
MTGTQRIRIVPEPGGAATFRHSHSLRRVLWLGVGAGMIVAIVAFVGVTARILDLTDRRAEARGRYNTVTGAHKDRLAALFEEQVAQRAYLTLGDPQLLEAYDRGRRGEIDALGQIAANLEPADRATLAGKFEALEAAIHEWREVEWRPRLLARQGQTSDQATASLPASLRVVEKAFDTVRAAHAAVDHGLAAAADRTFRAYQRSLRIIVIGGVVLLALITVFMMMVVSWTLRRTVRPLEELVRAAAAGGEFPRPDAGTGIREVDALTQALFELDLTVRDREHRVATAHAEAVQLGRFGEHVQQMTDEDEMQSTLAAHLHVVSPATAVHTLMRNTSHARLDVAYSTSGPIERSRLPILSEPMKCRAVRTLQRVIDHDGSPTACRCPLVPAGGSYLCKPLLAAGDLIGVVNLQADAGGFDDDDIRRIRGIVGHGSTALASLRLLAATRDRALRDPLTGAYNRAFLDEYLGKQLAVAERADSELGMLLVDLDHFKRLNDTYGHQVGDRALVAAVTALQKTLRTSDAVVRYGGEELAVVLPGTSFDGALEAGERARRAIEDIALATEQGTVSVRASIGVSGFPRHGRDQATLIAAADRALYQAKATGRNRVVAAEGDAGPAMAVRGAPATSGN